MGGTGACVEAWMEGQQKHRNSLPHRTTDLMPLLDSMSLIRGGGGGGMNAASRGNHNCKKVTTVT